MVPLLMGLALAVGAPAPKEASKKDPPPLVGEWVPESAVHGGMVRPIPTASLVTFAAEGKCTLREGIKGMSESYHYRTDAKKDPAHFDLSELRMGEKEMLGIYKIDGDTLTICLNEDGGTRPTTFASPGKSTLTLLILKRAKKE